MRAMSALPDQTLAAWPKIAPLLNHPNHARFDSGNGQIANLYIREMHTRFILKHVVYISAKLFRNPMPLTALSRPSSQLN
jgi:hypothetical protein